MRGAVLLFCFGLVAPGLAAQDDRPLRPGDRVRLVRTDGPPVVGVYRGFAERALLVEREPGGPAPVAVSRDQLTRLERSEGIRRRIGTGALVGGGLGLGTALLFLAGFCGGDNLCDGDEEAFAITVFTVPGIVLGAGVGALIRYEKWRGIPLDRLRLELGHSGAPIRLGWSIPI